MRVMVTGCSTGIGLATAAFLAHRGDQVVAGVRSPDSARELGDALAGTGAEVVRLDVDDRASVDAAVAHAVETLGGLDALVNNAGISQLAAVEDLREKDASALIETNYLGPLRMCQAVIPLMRSQGSGTIVNVSSMNAQAAFAFTGGYAASKAALEAMSEALALEVQRFGISVAIVQPGVFDSAIARNSLPGKSSTHYPGEVERLDEGRTAVAAGAPPLDDAARSIAAILDDPDPPLRTPLGRDAKGILRRRRSMDDREFFEWVRGLDRPDPAPVPTTDASTTTEN